MTLGQQVTGMSGVLIWLCIRLSIFCPVFDI